MSDPKNENAGDAAESRTQASPAAPAPEASEAQTQATPAAEAAPAQEQVAATAADQPTAVMPPAHAAVPAAGPTTAWYRRRWAVITGSVAAGVILFLGGMAVGSTIDGNDRGDFGRGDFHGQMSPDGSQGSGRQGWGDSGSQGMGGGQGMMPPMSQGGQGYGHDFDQDGDQGHHWDQDGGQGYGQPQQAPSTAPSVAPSTTPQAYYQ